MNETASDLRQSADARDIETVVAGFCADLRRLRQEIGTMIVGQENIVEGVMMCLLGGGHALLEGVPGLGKTNDESISGVHGKGPSTREPILSAAQKGFASRSYREVYVRYKTALEEVINAEKVPSGYKYYVKKYFQKIKPPE